MSRITLGTVVALGLGFAAWATAGLAHESTDPSPNRDLIAASTEMMQGIGDSATGRKAMRDFTQSHDASRAMVDMMAMARHTGNGDVTLTRMIEMMKGDMMGGQGMVAPPPEPGK